MVRLINADALLKAIIEYPYGYRGMIESEIANQQTVDAIPIEFIRERMEGYYKNSYTELGACLEALIEDWRKDNGESN